MNNLRAIDEHVIGQIVFLFSILGKLEMLAQTNANHDSCQILLTVYIFARDMNAASCCSHCCFAGWHVRLFSSSDLPAKSCVQALTRKRGEMF